MGQAAKVADVVVHVQPREGAQVLSSTNTVGSTTNQPLRFLLPRFVGIRATITVLRSQVRDRT